MLDWIWQMDLGLFHFINSSLSNNYFDIFFPFITDLHKSIYFMITVYPLVLFAFLWKFKKKGLLIFLFFILTLGTTDLVGNWVFKKQFQRARPGDNTSIQVHVRSPYGGYSFVSNHAANMFAFALAMSFLFPVGRVLFYLLAVLIAFSRVYNGVHYPSDVILGAILGLAMASVYILILKKWIFYSKKVIE